MVLYTENLTSPADKVVDIDKKHIRHSRPESSLKLKVLLSKRRFDLQKYVLELI